jgi:hypothetical protein
VVVTLTEGDIHIDLHSELAGMLSLCREGRRSGGFDPETVVQIKVVPGAYNHLRRTFIAWARPWVHSRPCTGSRRWAAHDPGCVKTPPMVRFLDDCGGIGWGVLLKV